MILLYASVIFFNILAFITVKRFSKNLIVHIWSFTCAFQMIFDVFVDIKYHGYWYVTLGVDWAAFPAYTVLIPPVNLMFLNWFPFRKSLLAKLVYIGVWEVMLLFYEYCATLPEPWGFFHYGWWNLWISGFVNPLLLLTLVVYYKFILRLEENLKLSMTEPGV